MPIDQDYMSPNLRWGLYLQDHPGSPEPLYEIVNAADTSVPAAWCVDELGEPVQDFVRCTLRDSEGRIVARGTKAIPVKERRQNGPTVELKRNAETWQKLRTMALGRALKAAGYPDKAADLRVFLTYRHRLIELGLSEGSPAVGAGGAVAAPAPALPPHDPATGEILNGAEAAAADEEEVAEGEIVDGGEAADAAADEEDFDDEQGAPPTAPADRGYPPDLASEMEQLGPDQRQELTRWMETTGYTTQVLWDREAALHAAVRKARTLRQKAGQSAS